MDDFIRRQDAIRLVEKHYRAHDNDELELIAYEVGRLPSAQPQQKTGRWEYHLGKCVCVACGSEFDESSPYCPMCGTFNGGE